ncbi:hypothetical protein DV735_g662, partial [Chaetothyriales sp. CBS 134920]
MDCDHSSSERLRARIQELENELESFKNGERQRLATGRTASATPPAVSLLPISPSLTHMLLLSDSALPIGSFAYSSGLESFLMHQKQKTTIANTISLFKDNFLPLSIHSFCHTTVPYVLSAFENPLDLEELDNDLDASTPCTVARRASISQGRALLAVWSKAFSSSVRRDIIQQNHVNHPREGNAADTNSNPNDDGDGGIDDAALALDKFAHALKLAAISPPSVWPSVNGHLAPLWGCMCKALGLSLQETAYLFVFNHAKGIISAAVRASVMGPYMAQMILASDQLERSIRHTLERVWFLSPDEATQVVPSIDLWLGRHEMLYSRIFNS